jgi:CheY-like chemotaxis protein
MNQTPPGSAPLSPDTRRFVHDLRNCIASIRAGASMLHRAADQPAIIERIADGLHDQVQEMLDLVDKFIGRPPERTEHDVVEARKESLRILIADDNADAANALATYLRLSGHRPIVTYDGNEALKLAAAEPPDVMLLDISMPILSGYDIARAVRAEPWGARVRLVAISGWFSPEDIDRASDAGFDEHLSKPLDMDTLPRILQGAR